mmetsp:Transcript_40974/g.49208  ORF Transcript_40974/g.49208 Transcript_40974/m.49208 type:complete len:377 (-) Transcript_40974:392-1522(-)
MSDPSSSSTWRSRQVDAFGYPFLICCCVVYFAQGFRSLSSLFLQFLLKDRMSLEPHVLQTTLATSALPWSLKPLYGLVSDSFPIHGRHRKPYLVVAAFLGVGAWIALALATYEGVGVGTGGIETNEKEEEEELSLRYITILLTLSNFSTALSDVIVDAMVAERCGDCARKAKAKADSNGDKSGGVSSSVTEGEDALQSLCWGSLAVGGLVGSLLGIVAVSTVPPWGIFLATAACPGFVLAASALLTEPIKEATKEGVTLSGWKQSQAAVRTQLTSLTTALSQPTIWRPLLFFFLKSAELLAGHALLFHRCPQILQGIPIPPGYRFSKLFWCCQIASLSLQLLNVLLVSRITTPYLPDKVFVLGTDVLGTVLNRVTS